MAAGTLTDVPGLRVGHATDLSGITGCTVILCEQGAVGGVDVRGWASGTREIEALAPEHVASHVHAIVLAGGSAFGLDAATGVARYLDERGVGFQTGAARVPIVAGAILYDLSIGDSRARPNAGMGYEAGRVATSKPVVEGSVGAGVGATVGKLFGLSTATKGGVGSASVRLSAGVVVGALVVVNAYGDVVDPGTGAVVAGARRTSRGRRFVGMRNHLLADRRPQSRKRAPFGNTTLCVVATNARLSKVEATEAASVAHDGLARVVSPAHTSVDGDVVFALSVGRRRASVDLVAIAGVRAIELATLRAVERARGCGGVPAVRDLRSRASS